MTPVKDSFHYKAATFGCLSPGLAIILAMIGGLGSFRINGVDWYTAVFDIASFTVAISGIAGGVIGLFGIPKYGKKELLWRSLAGLSFPLIFVIAYAFAAFAMATTLLFT